MYKQTYILHLYYVEIVSKVTVTAWTSYSKALSSQKANGGILSFKKY